MNISVDLDWVHGKPLQYYLEKARDVTFGTPQEFTFALSYNGVQGAVYFGYFVVMMLDNKHYNNYNNNNCRWMYSVNNASVGLGVDVQYPMPGDVIVFQYVDMNN